MTSPSHTLQELPEGTRVVVRYRIAQGLTDALGYLRGVEADTAFIETRSGLVRVPLDDVVAAKRVPPPPERRAPRHPRDA